MPSTTNLADRIAAEAATLPAEKQSKILDFVLFVKQRVLDDDEAWERTIAEARPRPRLDAFLRDAAAEGGQPLDPARL
jgi:hypothetical protein